MRGRAATSTRPPGHEVADFEEYTRLYREAWSDPDIRWLLATVPSTMIFDDHDVHDDWNISEAWVRDMRATRLVGGAHHAARSCRTGSTSTSATSRRPSSQDERDARAPSTRRTTAGRRCGAFARVADRDTTASRFAFHRDFGRSRLVVIDSRAARVLADGARDMVDAEEWQLDRRARARQLRPPDHREHAARLHARARSTTSRRGTRRSARARWGSLAGARRREAAPRARPRALAGLPAIVRDACSSCCTSSPRAGRSGIDHLIGGDVHTAYIAEVELGHAAAEPRLPGRLLAVPEPADGRASGARSALLQRRAAAGALPRRSRARQASPRRTPAGGSSRR